MQRGWQQFTSDDAVDPADSVPRITDIPPIEVVLVDRPDLPSAGAGETPIVAIAPAIGNAIHAATGTRLRSMPLVPDGTVAHDLPRGRGSVRAGTPQPQQA